jgi:diaminohydroxyphosphoribosylaminopyrimidine deaminase/5-amino-6-(5-phosphoribosylamino)uracil reductase
MALALRLARRGLYSTHPNPRVGCVIAKGEDVLAQGWHEKAGGPHAEVMALAAAGVSAKGAVAYVTLEPCSHYGRTGPCADALIASGVSKVVVAMQDPNPEVGGNGIKKLLAAGIDVEIGLLEEDARALNVGFIRRMTKGVPHVTVKLAMSLDGRTAMASGESKWITAPPARHDVQKLRARSSAILTAVDTVKLDDPSLTVREDELVLGNNQLGICGQPLRVILDRDGQLRGNEKVFDETAQVVYVVEQNAHPAKCIESALHIDVVRLGLQSDGRFQLTQVLELLAERGVNELLVESGAGLAGSFVEQSCVDSLVVYVAPKIMGSAARGLFDLPYEKMAESRSLELTDMRMVGDDVRLSYVMVNHQNKV